MLGGGLGVLSNPNPERDSSSGVAFAQQLPSEDPFMQAGPSRLERMSPVNAEHKLFIESNLLTEGQCAEIMPIRTVYSGETQNYIKEATEERCNTESVSLPAFSNSGPDGLPVTDPYAHEKRLGNPFVVENVHYGISDELDYLLATGKIEPGCVLVDEIFSVKSRAQNGLYGTRYSHVFMQVPCEVPQQPEAIATPIPSYRVCEEVNLNKGQEIRMNGQTSAAMDGKIEVTQPDGTKKVFITNDKGAGSETTSHLTLVTFDGIDVLPEGEMVRYISEDGPANIYCPPTENDYHALCNNLSQYLEAWVRQGQTPSVHHLRRDINGWWSVSKIEGSELEFFRNPANCDNYQA